MDHLLQRTEGWRRTYKPLNNITLYLHNCEAIQDVNCAQIYKSLLVAVSHLGHRLDREIFNWMDEMEKRAELNRLAARLVRKGLIVPREGSGGFEVADQV